jgi:hypothetical protein
MDIRLFRHPSDLAEVLASPAVSQSLDQVSVPREAGCAARIRKRIHGRPISPYEVAERIGPYHRRDLLTHKLYKPGMVRY